MFYVPTCMYDKTSEYEISEKFRIKNSRMKYLGLEYLDMTYPYQTFKGKLFIQNICG